MGSRQPSKLVVGARARITTPAFFVRCGYPMNVGNETARILGEELHRIDQLLHSFGVHRDPLGGISRGAREIAKAVAYEVCRAKKFGGRERTIYTREIPAAAGMEFTIESVRFVKTGTYQPASGHSYDWTGADDFEPAYLMDEQTHRILGTGLGAFRFDVEWDDSGAYALEIEACHVELVGSEVAAAKAKLTA